MQRLLIAMALLVASGLAVGPADAARKSAKCAENTDCNAGKHLAARKRADSGSEPTIERDGYVINRRNDSDPRSVLGGNN